MGNSASSTLGRSVTVDFVNIPGVRTPWVLIPLDNQPPAQNRNDQNDNVDDLNDLNQERLDFSQRILDYHACARLACELAHNVCVLELNLSGTNIGDAGAELLGNMLATNNTLTVLNLDYNENVTDASVFARGLLYNRTLHELRLAWTGVQPDSLRALDEEIRTNTTVQILGNNGMDLRRATILLTSSPGEYVRA
eukprot:m.1041722 g.1041722  ORF g.1041722 m.1041722 type:complete len:195 (+) comp24160_c0_seq5:457-1041(+)